MICIEPGSGRPRLLWWGDACVPTGFARVTHGVLAHLSALWDVHVLGINYRGDPHSYPYPVYPAGAKDDPLGINRVAEISAKVKPDLLMIQNDPWNIERFYRQVEQIGIPVVAWMPIDAKNLKSEYARALNRTMVAITASEFGLQVARDGGFSGWGEVVPYGVDLDCYAPVPQQAARAKLRLERFIPSGAYVVGAVNRNAPRKRFDLTIQAFARWRTHCQRDAYLYLHCAKRDLGWDLAQLAGYYGVRDRLLMTEEFATSWVGIDERKMPYIYSALDVQLSTTTGEGFGLTTLEGMACGIPQIVPDSAALGEWARGSARLVPTGVELTTDLGVNTVYTLPDLDGTVEALEELWRAPAERHRLATAGLALAQRPEYRWQNIAARLDEIFHKALLEWAQGKRPA